MGREAWTSGLSVCAGIATGYNRRCSTLATGRVLCLTQEQFSLLDTAPTLAHLLGIAPHAQWEGRCVEEILEL